jgi:hypothetical protein
VIVRQSLRERRSPLVLLGLLLLVPVALALIWYGAMLVALAFKAPPETVNAISGYRDAYDFLASLEAGDLLFFGRGGRRARAAAVDHMGIYAGGGWMIHSSRYGVALAPVDGWYAERFAWGRRPLAEAGLTA